MNLIHQSRSSRFVHQSAMAPPTIHSHSPPDHSGISTSSPAYLNFPAIWSAGPPMDKTFQVPTDAQPTAPTATTPPASASASTSSYSQSHYPSYHASSALSMAITLPPILPAHPLSYTIERTEPSSRSGSSSKEKRHGCQLCNKRFDRPSTLKKHLLVHTGVKAWACDICGRRFGVSSNLNRHARRCREKWQQEETARHAPDQLVASTSPSPPISSEFIAPAASISPPILAHPSPPSSSSQSSPTLLLPPPPSSICTPTLTVETVPVPQMYINRKRKDSPDATDYPFFRAYKRQRRPPSPVRWVPDSLLCFDLTPVSKSAPTPLPPVVPSMYEERNSYKDVGDNPYHRTYWEGNLVGPSYTGNNFVSTRGQGKLLVF